MIKEYIVKVTDEVLPNAFLWFETEYSPERELVRCKDCKYYPNGDGATFWVPCREMITASRWYCAYGEKNE